MVIQSDVTFPPSQHYGTGYNQRTISGWPPYTTPFEIHNSQYGYVSIDDHESYPGPYASPEKPCHGYATNHNYGTYPQNHTSTENYLVTQSYNLHSHSPSTHQVHGGHQNQHGVHQGYGHSGHQGYGHSGHQGYGHQVYGSHQGYGHQVYSDQQGYGHQVHDGQQGFGLWPPKDHKNNQYGHDNNCSTVYSAKKSIDD